MIAYQFADNAEVQEKFHLAKHTLNDALNKDDEYEKINAFSWSRDLVNSFNQYMLEISNDKHEIPRNHLFKQSNLITLNV